MVRPNQIIASNLEQGELTFLMFARTEEQVMRRVLFINFPSTIKRVLVDDEEVTDFVKSVQLVTEGMVNRYAVTLDTGAI